MDHKNLYIVDNVTENQTVKQYLNEWCEISKQMDIATGYLEVGGLLDLDGNWQKLDKIRIILGNEVTNRTKQVIDKVIETMIGEVKASIDREQEHNDFLIGIPAIIEAMRSRKIECRVYDKDKFHAKAYITYFKDEYKNQFKSVMNIPEGYALVGSSNFTHAGLTKNIELNVQVSDNVDALQQWYEDRWKEGVDITDAVLETMEMHCKEYSPYDVYLRSMYELFKGGERTVSEWESNESVVYKGLSQYQKDGYNSLIEIANRYSGAFLCDGVGLGKTYVGLMLIERFLLKERKNVVLMVPAAARESVWETAINKYMPGIMDGFVPFKIVNHTDLLSDRKESLIKQIEDNAEIIIIDEAHHFRNRSSNRYRRLFEIMGNGKKKKLFMLTATPINNSFLDLQHLIELFTQRQENYFCEAPLGIHNLTQHFKDMENRLQSITDVDVSDASDSANLIFQGDALVNALVVQRSRAYVMRSLSKEEGDKVLFATRQPPIVAEYSLEKSYGQLIKHFVDSFDRIDERTGNKLPILALAVYSPYEDAYYIGDKSKIDEMKSGRQQQVVNLIRQLLLKRFESSIEAFAETCIRIYVRLKKFVLDYQEQGNSKQIERLLNKQSDIIAFAESFVTDNIAESVEEFEDDLPDYVWNVEDNFDVSDFDIRAMIDDSILDMEVLADFIHDFIGFDSQNDDKIRTLERILRENEHIKNKKVIIFSEYRATAKYIYEELQKAGFKRIAEIDGQSNVNRHELIQRFAPYYNDKTSNDIEDEIDILISTDVLAEGLNLQDASCLINYDLHWNPVRLMQRIGRIDRRRSCETEEALLRDHPEYAKDRGNAFYWNFLPPSELDKLLDLYKTVSKKTLRISKTFGIEGKQLLTPDDDFEALKEFNSQYEGTTSTDEEMALAYQDLMITNPEYDKRVEMLPKKMYSGKLGTTRAGIFFCYELPTKRADGLWTDGDGLYRWYLLDPATNDIAENTYEIWKAILCEKEEARYLSVTEEQFREFRKTIEKHIKNTYLKSVQAPLEVKPRLVTWMQLK